MASRSSSSALTAKKSSRALRRSCPIFTVCSIHRASSTRAISSSRSAAGRSWLSASLKASNSSRRLVTVSWSAWHCFSWKSVSLPISASYASSAVMYSSSHVAWAIAVATAEATAVKVMAMAVMAVMAVAVAEAVVMAVAVAVVMAVAMVAMAAMAMVVGNGSQ